VTIDRTVIRVAVGVSAAKRQPSVDDRAARFVNGRPEAELLGLESGEPAPHPPVRTTSPPPRISEGRLKLRQTSPVLWLGRL